MEQLLIKEPWNRLGARDMGDSPNGLSEIRNHDFFRGVDWAAIDAGTASVPFTLCTGGNCSAKAADEDRAAFVVWKSEPADTAEVKTAESASSDSEDSADDSSASHSSAFLRLDGFSFCYDQDDQELQEQKRAYASTSARNSASTEDEPSNQSMPHVKAVLGRFDTPEHLKPSGVHSAA